MWENTTPSTELPRDFCAGISPLQLGVVLVYKHFIFCMHSLWYCLAKWDHYYTCVWYAINGQHSHSCSCSIMTKASFHIKQIVEWFTGHYETNQMENCWFAPHAHLRLFIQWWYSSQEPNDQYFVQIRQYIPLIIINAILKIRRVAYQGIHKTITLFCKPSIAIFSMLNVQDSSQTSCDFVAWVYF